MLERYEWDAPKAIANVRKHGISFEEAVEAMADPDSLVRYDETHSLEEDRFRLIGLSSAGVLLVVFAERHGGDTYRIISARHAKRKEKNLYYEDKL